MKGHTCWTKMLTSMTFFCKRNSDSKASAINSKASKKQSIFQKQPSKLQDKQNPKIQVQKNTLSIINESRNQKPLDNTFKQKENQFKNKKEANPSSEDNEPGETQRNLVESQIESQVPGQSDQQSLPTQKSDIIMNDIGKGIDHNENIFLFNENPSSEDKFSEVYQKIQFLKKSFLYEEHLVKKKTTGEIMIAYILRSYESFMEEWKVDEEEGIERYSNLYEREKHHIKSLLTLAKNNCRHLLRLIDYELHSPTISTNSDKKFTPGSVVVVFEAVESNLSEVLADKENSLSKYEKKKLIYQICACLSDINKNRLTVKDLSIQTFGLDKFGLIKANSLEIEQFDAKFDDCHYLESQRNVLYLTPEELKILNKSSRNASEQKSVNSGISYFDTTEISPETQDLWRLGIIVCKILTGKFIFDGMTPNQQQVKINEVLKDNNEKTVSQLFQKKLSLAEKEYQTVQSLLKINPNERFTCKRLLETQYLANILQDSDEDS